MNLRKLTAVALLLLLAPVPAPCFGQTGGAGRDAPWDDLLSLSDGARATPRVRQTADEFIWSETVRELPPRDMGETGASTGRFYAKPETHRGGALRERGEFSLFHPDEGRSAFDPRRPETPRVNPYARARDINRRNSPFGSREYNGTDAYIAPGMPPLSRSGQRAYRANGWTSEAVRRRLAEVYGTGCCGE